MANRNVTPRESDEQQALFRWAAYAAGTWPELRCMYHIPNEGQRTARTGARLKLEGLRAGVPDICLPVPRGGYGALYIELKRTKGGALSDSQRQWLDALNAAGNKAVVCYGWDAARAEIERYLEGT